MSDTLPPVTKLLTQEATQLSEMASLLKVCFQREFSLSLGKVQGWSAEQDFLKQFARPGLVVALMPTEAGGYLIALPESLPLPSWYLMPGALEQMRLQEMATNWSGVLLSGQKEVSPQAAAVQSHDLATAITWSCPVPEAEIVEFLVQTTDPSEDFEQASEPTSFWIIGPVETPPTLDRSEVEEEDLVPEPEKSMSGLPADEDAEANLAAEAAARHAQELLNRVRRLLPLTVTVSVRLAEMKIELSTLASLCPGSLLVFPKSCDDLLDLYVNNKLYAQGEAVKIGEKFGLKVNLVGAQKKRQSGVFSLTERG